MDGAPRGARREAGARPLLACKSPACEFPPCGFRDGPRSCSEAPRRAADRALRARRRLLFAAGFDDRARQGAVR
eukprot:1303630-Prymnesium_polylepis.1